MLAGQPMPPRAVLLVTRVLFALLFATGTRVQAGNDIVAAARSQIGVTTSYDPAYRQLRYPAGDVSADRGVCTDVIVRALRQARAIDLQRKVHENMKAN